MNMKIELAKQDLVNIVGGKILPCDCGRNHKTDLQEAVIRQGALKCVPDMVKKYGGTHPYVIADKNTYAAAGKTVCKLLKDAGIQYESIIFQDDLLKPDELSVGRATMYFRQCCDIIIGIGGGTINDISKILSNVSGRPYLMVGTAPSMDGFASATSSMALEGVKVSLPSCCPTAIIADIDIMRNAPMELLRSGLGDMMAKYISICEWRISHVVTGEYYCENIAGLVRSSLQRCMESAEGLLNREPQAVVNVVEGLILCGMAMSFAGLSRPASGMEHYFSHLWDMRALELGTQEDLHGIQCAVGTVLSLEVYDKVIELIPNKEKALAYAANFDLPAWNETLHKFLGKGAENMIGMEKKEGKYDVEKHKPRLDVLLANWDKIQKIIAEELPPKDRVIDALKKIGAPITPFDLGLTSDIVKTTFLATKDIRDKYIGSRLLWDLGEIDKIAQELFGN